MTDLWICPDQVFDGDTLHHGMALRLRGDEVTMLARNQMPAGAKVRQIAGIVSPGFVDLQVNGGGGVMLNQSPTVAAMDQMAEAHAGLGTVAILPTVITDAPEVLAAAAEAALAAHERGSPRLLGLHIEGPHIDPARRGTHASRFIRPLDEATLSIVTRLRDAGVPVMITLAPEAATLAQISALAETGAVVSLGHSDCTTETARAAFAAGASCATHLFNAMSQMGNRAPGLVGAVINGGAYSGIICDGIHVADDMVGLAIRARPEPDRMFLVSDAMATVGGPDHFDLYGQRITLRDGKLVNAEGSLAGAHVTQAEGLARLVGVIGVAPDAALRMVVTVPARVIGAEGLSRISGRAPADLVVLGPDMTWQGSLADHLAAVAAQ
ncbi:N-acetylglucosamine-6-phosphate deacetylase [Flavimaricola marinus]|uniref:N-acetylglucosamine-6-phosphate deacetylase n=1 Tax=Flavimaricola marinus TaxID=1819565 RepID=A0A238LAM2_9RHOB|nr:N-acetylglucosamine-6-phosphate deacetylase [Flavimaricola marinus]SMY06661.1 N-acetylglucosamine-6-phosphate deacetylase [Flavimaricola marinus]